MLTSLRHNLGKLGQFSGRTSWQAFWLYAMIVLLIDFAVWGAVFSTVFSQMLAISKVTTEHSHLAVFSAFENLIVVMAVIVAGTVLLLAAAVTRRLHDRDKSGWWALPPPIFLANGLALMAYLFVRFSSEEPDMTLFFLLILNNLTYLATLLVLIVLLAGSPSVGPNRFGEPPAKA